MEATMEILGECIAGAIKRQYNYLRDFDSNYQKLKDAARALEDTRRMLQIRVDTAKSNAEVILPEVDAWFKDVKDIQAKMTEIKSKITNIQSGCFAVKSRRSLSKKAEDTTKAMKDLQDRCHIFNVISQPPPPAAAALVPLPYQFESRKQIEEAIMKTLRDEDVNIVGIWGMGGVGKTTMAKEIMKRVMEEHLFDEVVMVAVGKNVDESKIQDVMAEQLGLTLEEKNSQSRAHKLHTRLTGEKRILVVVDDVWEKLKLEELGIPCEISSEGCKILLTSQDWSVLDKMDAQKVCCIQTLCEEEALSLFKKKVGPCVDDQNLLSIAQEIVKECKGLPIALVNIGGVLKNQSDRLVWEVVLDQLRSSIPERVPNFIAEVYSPLKLSYDFLVNEQAKFIFLLCCLFPEDYDIPLEYLTVYAMGLNMLGRIMNLEQARNKICLLVDMLKSRFLLLEGGDDSSVRMHDVVRDVAISIASEQRLINCSDCTWISPYLRERIELSTKSIFPNLRLIVIDESEGEELQIDDNFFEGTTNLNVLSIKYNSLRSLPHSTQLLKDLRALILYSCPLLGTMSVVGELVNLEIFICNYCEKIEELPEIGRLDRLQLLRLESLPRLKNLWKSPYQNVVSLRNLSSIYIKNCDSLRTLFFLSTAKDCLLQLERLQIEDCKMMEQVFLWNEEENEKDIGKSYHITMFPKLKSLRLWYLPNLTTFYEGIESFEFPLLTEIDIGECPNLKSLVYTTSSAGGINHDDNSDDGDSLHLFCYAEFSSGSLKELKISYTDTLRIWCRHIPINFFIGLEILRLGSCDNIRSLLSSPIAQNLVNLKELEIRFCSEIVKAIEDEEEKYACGGETHCLFPNLKELCLIQLPKLKSFCEWRCALQLPSLKFVNIFQCPEMERFSFGSLTTPNMEKIIIDHDHDVYTKDLNDVLQQRFSSLERGSSAEHVYLPASSSKATLEGGEQFSPLKKTTEISAEDNDEERLRGSSAERLSLPASSSKATLGGGERFSPLKKNTKISGEDDDEAYDLETSKCPTQTVSREQLERCIEHCQLFLPDSEFEKDKLVQMWIAEECIKTEVRKRMEDVANLYFDDLVHKEVIVPSKFDNLHSRMKYKVNTSETSNRLPERGGEYVRIDTSNLNEICREAETSNRLPKREGDHVRIDTSICREAKHLTWQCKRLDQTLANALKDFKQLRTLVVHAEGCGLIKQLPDDFFLGLSSLRTLDMSRTHISELPASIGMLESLRYLDISETPIEELPESLDCLYSLETLKLKGCFGLFTLPRGLGRLINLRHLDLDILGQLKSMPKEMGNLIELQTLQAFIVGKNERCGIGELKNLNEIVGSFCISGLENVANAEKAKEAALGDKKRIDKLELRWHDHGRNDDFQDTAEILECLQPHFHLRELQLTFYNGSRLPSWISNPSFTDLASITLYRCINCDILPSIGELPSLKILDIVGMKNVRKIDALFFRNHRNKGFKAFPRLEKLTLDDMLNLEKWTTIRDGDFPCLRHVSIRYCPKLRAFPSLSRLSFLQHLEISHCMQLMSLPKHKLPASLESLIISGCPRIKGRCLRRVGGDRYKIASVKNIWIDFEKISLD